MKKKAKRNPADLTKCNNDARKKEITKLKQEITIIWNVMSRMKIDIDGVWEQYELLSMKINK